MVYLVLEFFSYEAIWAASSTLKMIFWTKTILMGFALAFVSVLLSSVAQWPRGEEFQMVQKYNPSDTGEEHLVTRHDLGIVQDRNREVQSELRESISLMRDELKALHTNQQALNQFQSRIEEKLNIWTTVMGIGFSAVVAQLIGYLLNMRLRKDQRAHEDDQLKKTILMMKEAGVVFTRTGDGGIE